MASRRHLTVAQNLISGKYGRVKLLTETTDESELDASTLDIFNHGQPLGLSPGYADNGRLIALAIADDENCRIVEFQRTANKRDTLQAKVLCRDAGDVFAFNMGPLSMSLFSDLQLRISNAVDIQSAFSAVERNPLTAIRKIVGDSIQIFPENVEQLFREPIYDQKNRAQLAIRAWVSQFLATYENGQEVFDKVPRIDTGKFADEKLKWLAKLSIDALRLDNKKPTQVSHPVVLSPGTTKGVQLQSLSYDNKLRRNKDVRVSVTQGNINYSVHGSVGAILGKKSLLETGRELQEVTVAEVTSIGREDPTTAEAHRAATMLRILQGSQELFIENPWVQNIYLPPADGLMSWPEEWSKHIPTPSSSPPKAIAQLQQLNKSQQMAVNTMFSQLDENRVTLIQGPPGTGKTSVIAAFVQCSISLGRTGIWLVAKSNVAVKNIAEKLIKVGFYDWRLLVSKDFHFDWHEHLYTNLKKNIIVSENFKYATSQLHGVSVILCTLSMVANSHVKTTFVKKVPMNYLVVDEASQIEIGDYISAFTLFDSTLRKVCFIGDDKQLPPFGQEDLQDLQSVFEITHLNKNLIFLDTQYRMPPQIGQFISGAVYSGQLKSNPQHPVQDHIQACKFINAGGKERRSGTSFENQAECEAIIKLAIKLQELEKSYRIITPYTRQRQLIEDQMKLVPDLLWGDKCFSVDSFQGNEDDFIIISVVRSLEIGFLKNLRRTNVMLTRCKRGMFIVSSQHFLTGPGAQSLVGEMAKSMGSEAWLEVSDIEVEEFLAH